MAKKKQSTKAAVRDLHRHAAASVGRSHWQAQRSDPHAGLRLTRHEQS